MRDKTKFLFLKTSFIYDRAEIYWSQTNHSQDIPPISDSLGSDMGCNLTKELWRNVHYGTFWVLLILKEDILSLLAFGSNWTQSTINFLSKSQHRASTVNSLMQFTLENVKQMKNKKEMPRSLQTMIYIISNHFFKIHWGADALFASWHCTIYKQPFHILPPLEQLLVQDLNPQRSQKQLQPKKW